MTAYYNEFDPFAAAWLRELIADGLIAHGEVDERSIEDVTPNDLRPFRQCHFFAGIGVWSLAARRAGILDDAPLWTGSCPCQPFSAAGKGSGFADERHLWPAFHYLIEQCRPALVVGEQVAGADGDAWLDLVSADMDATGYAFGAAETVAAGFGAPHKRSRNYWVAQRMDDAAAPRHQYARGGQSEQPECGQRLLGLGREPLGMAHDPRSRWGEERPDIGGGVIGDSAQGRATGLGDGRGAGRLADAANGDGRGGERRAEEGIGPHGQRRLGPSSRDDSGGMADANGGIAGNGHIQPSGQHGLIAAHGGDGWWPNSGARHGLARRMERPGPVNGLWRNADWLRCRDEKWRPVEPGTFPLADAGSVRNRVGLLRGAGNAITLGQAEGFLRAVIAALQ